MLRRQLHLCVLFCTCVALIGCYTHTVHMMYRFVRRKYLVEIFSVVWLMVFLVTGQFGEGGVHFVGKTLVSVLVETQFVYAAQKKEKKRFPWNQIDFWISNNKNINKNTTISTTMQYAQWFTQSGRERDKVRNNIGSIVPLRIFSSGAHLEFIASNIHRGTLRHFIS